MKPGDMVQTVPTLNHSGSCYRIYNFPEKYKSFPDSIGKYSSWEDYIRSMVDKLYHNEVAIVMEVREDIGFVKIMNPRNCIGWIKMNHLKVV